MSQKLQRCKTCALALTMLYALPVLADLRPTTPSTPERQKQGDLELGVSGYYYDTKKSFDSSGTSVSLLNDGELIHWASALFAEYSFREDFAFLSSLSMANTQVDTSQIRRSRAGVDDLMLGGRYTSLQTAVNLFAQASIEFPLYPRPNSSDWSTLNPASQAPLGSGAAAVNVTGWLELPLNDWSLLGASFGYTYRTQGYSSYFPYAAYLKLFRDKGIFARAGLRGIFTATSDQYSGNVSDPQRSQALLDGSQYFNAINPNFLAADAAFGIYLTPQFDIAAGYEREVAGKDVSVGNLLTAAFTFHLNTEPESQATSKANDSSGSNRGFHEYAGQARVIQANHALHLILIDQGKNQGIKKGDLMDVFAVSQDVGTALDGQALARGKVQEVGPTRSKIEIIEIFPTGRDADGKEIPILEGFVVRKPLP